MSRNVKAFVIISVVAVFWIVTAPFLANSLIIEKPLEKADVIFVLSGSAVFEERTAKAASVYKSGLSKMIVLSDDGGEAGWSRVEERNPKFVELARKSLEQKGVKTGDIIVLNKHVTGTIYEAEEFTDAAKRNNWNSVMLVTSAYHTRRAYRTFEKELDGTGVRIGILSPPPGEQTPPAFTWWLSPKGWRLVGGEYLKSVYYWLFY